MLEHLLSVWPEVSKQFRTAERILLLTDYDGTLIPIVERPELADLPADTRQLLQELVDQRRFTLGIVSGRELSDLKGKVAVDGIIYVGNHGLEIEGAGSTFVNLRAEALRPTLKVIYHMLVQSLEGVKGVLIENKGLSLSVHYRLAGESEAPHIESIVRKITRRAQVGGRVKITSGKKVYEVRPAVDWNKGEAVKLLIEKYDGRGGQRRLLSIYLGDDLTDEDGFKVIAHYMGGISVFVGEPTRKSSARYFLNSPAEVSTFLQRLLDQAGKDSDNHVDEAKEGAVKG